MSWRPLLRASRPSGEEPSGRRRHETVVDARAKGAHRGAHGEAWRIQPAKQYGALGHMEQGLGLFR